MPEADLEISRVAARQYGVVSMARLRAIGLTDGQIRRRVLGGRLHPLHRGVYVVGHANLALRGRWLAAVLALGPGALLSHADAAALWNLRRPTDGPVHVLTAGGSRSRRRGIVVHRSRRLHPDDCSLVDRIPVTSVARTLLDLAATRPRIQLQRAYERAERERLLDVEAIRSLLARSNGHRGAGRLGALLAYDPAPAAEAVSELELLFLDLIRRAGLPAPQVNVLVDDFLVDAYWPEARLVVELDGYAYHSDREAFERDHARALRLRLAGFGFLAFTYHQVVGRPRFVVAAIAEELARPRSPRLAARRQ